MGQQRYTGVLKKWNTERGFGFIVADDGGQEIFAHITAFARNGSPPSVGERLTFEVEPDSKGRRSAVRVRRPNAPLAATNSRRPRRDDDAAGSKLGSFVGTLIALLLMGSVAWFVYSQYTARAAGNRSVLPLPATLSPAKLPVPPGFRCDGRKWCSQMTSCREATLFLQNCPGMEMDGDHDGVPCEQQWCG